MADRVVDKLNPDAHLTLKDLKSLVCENEEDPPPKVFGENIIQKLRLSDPILGCVLERWGTSLTEIPMHLGTLVEKDSMLGEEEKETAERLYKQERMGDPSTHLGSQRYATEEEEEEEQEMVIIEDFYLPDKTTMFPVGTRVTLIRKKKNVWTMKMPDGKFLLRRDAKLAPVASVPIAQPAVAPSVAPAVDVAPVAAPVVAPPAPSPPPPAPPSPPPPPPPLPPPPPPPSPPPAPLPAPSQRVQAMIDYIETGRAVRPPRSTPGPVVRPNVNAARRRH